MGCRNPTCYCAFKISTLVFSLNVWAGITDKFLIGPFFLDGKLTGTKYVDFLSTRLHEILEEIPVDIRLRMWFMHDGAPSHFSLE